MRPLTENDKKKIESQAMFLIQCCIQQVTVVKLVKLFSIILQICEQTLQVKYVWQLHYFNPLPKILDQCSQKHVSICLFRLPVVLFSTSWLQTIVELEPLIVHHISTKY